MPTIFFCIVLFCCLNKGIVVLVFQQAGEGGVAAKKILDSRVLENVSAIFGLHIDLELPMEDII